MSALATNENVQIPEGSAALSRDNTSQNLQNIWQDIAEFFGWGDQPSKWTDVKSWQPVGNRFATAYGEDGQLLALYDLSYPSLRKKISLGVIGSPMIGPGTLIDAALRWSLVAGGRRSRVPSRQCRVKGSQLAWAGR